MIQLLISRFGGLPATILKIALLSVVNALAIWAIPAMASNGSWVMMAFIVVATIALDYLLLTKRFIPAKYVVIGAIFLAELLLVGGGWVINPATTEAITSAIPANVSNTCLLYTSPSPRDRTRSRMPSSA